MAVHVRDYSMLSVLVLFLGIPSHPALGRPINRRRRQRSENEAAKEKLHELPYAELHELPCADTPLLRCFVIYTLRTFEQLVL